MRLELGGLEGDGAGDHGTWSSGGNWIIAEAGAIQVPTA